MIPVNKAGYPTKRALSNLCAEHGIPWSNFNLAPGEAHWNSSTHDGAGKRLAESLRAEGFEVKYRVADFNKTGAVHVTAKIADTKVPESKTPDTDAKIRKIIVDRAVEGLQEFGYPHVNSENIFTGSIERQFFERMLEQSLGDPATDRYVNDLLSELAKKGK